MNKIRLACNWSYPLKNLLEEDAVSIDYIKTALIGGFYEEFDEMLRFKPVLIHGLGYREQTGMNNLSEVDFTRANILLKKCCSPHYGLHFGIDNADADKMTDKEIYTFMSEQTRIFKQKLDVPLLIENMPDSVKHRTVFNIYSCFDHKNISRFIIENEVNLLLDLSHASNSAIYNGWDIKKYILNLPLERVKEIHVNGYGFDEKGNVEDTHQSMKDKDYELLLWVLESTSPEIITLEYSCTSGDIREVAKENLVTQLDKLKAICDNY